MKYYFALLLSVFSINLTQADTIEKKGFIVEKGDGVYFLSSVPVLKSCCIGKVGEAIKLKGDVSSYSRFKPVSLKGQIVNILDEAVFEIENFTVQDGAT